MIFYIDAYNILHTMISHLSKTKKELLINQIIYFCKKNNHLGVIVFDGGGGYFISEEKYENHIIVYSGREKSADDYIISKVNQLKSRRDIVVVTYDRELLSSIKNLFFVPMEPEAFLLLIKKNDSSELNKKYGNTIQKKTTDYFDNELDSLMNGISTIPNKKNQEAQEKNKSKKNKLEKKIDIFFKKISKT